MTTVLGERLRYLSNMTLACSIIMETYGIPAKMDPVTKLILEEIEKLGVKLVIGEGNKITITSVDFKRFWRQVNVFTLSSMTGAHYGLKDALVGERIRGWYGV
jgi:hypothetical protein